MKEILVATDLSENAKNAIKQAFLWAKTFDARVKIVNVSEALVDERECFSGPFNTFKDDSIQCLDRHYKDLADHLEEFSGEEFTLEHWQGHAVYCILKAQAKNKSELIISGVIGQNTFRRAFLGSVAQRLVEQSPVSVFCVSSDLTEFPKSALYCCDFLLKNRQAYDMAQTLGKNLELTLYHLINPQTVVKMAKDQIDINSLDEAIERSKKNAIIELEQIAETLSPKPKYELDVSDHMSPGEQIIEFANTHSIELLLLGAHDDKQKWYMGSTSDFVSRRSKTSFLVCR